MPQILLVEDEPAVQEVIRRALARQGYRVLTASDGLTALEILDQISPDLIILDIYLPPPDGRQVVHEYRQRSGPHAPILIMTGGGHAAERATALGAAGSLDKPFSLQELRTKVEALIGTPYPVSSAQAGSLHQILRTDSPAPSGATRASSGSARGAT